MSEKFTLNDRHLLLQSPLFAEFTEGELSMALKSFKKTDYKRNDLVFAAGDTEDYIYIVAEGWVRVFSVNSEGEQVVHYLLSTGDSYGEASIMQGNRHFCSAQIAGKTASVLSVPADDVRGWIKDKPQLSMKIIYTLSSMLNQARFGATISSQLTAAQKLAAYIYKLCLSRGGAQLVRFPYNKYLVAERLGMKSETFSRAMRRLEDDLDISFSGREVTINDIAALQDYAEITCLNDNCCSLKERILCNDSVCDLNRLMTFFK